MMTLDEQIAVLQAYKEGKTIQWYNETKEEWDDATEDALKPLLEFRIKPEPKLRPYKNMRECLKDLIQHGPYILCKDDRELCYVVVAIDDYGIAYGQVLKDDFGYMMRNYNWKDGSPCGIEEELK